MAAFTLGWPLGAVGAEPSSLVRAGTLAILSTVADHPLVEAAKHADRVALERLLADGTDVNVRSGDGSTALLWASHWDDHEAAALLIGGGADVNAANELGATPLWSASMNGSEAMVKRLLEAGANPNLKLRLGETPLMVASRSGNPAVVQALIEAGAEVNHRGPRSQTALMWAAAQQHEAVVRVLLSAGADVHARSEVWSQMMGHQPHSHPEHQRWFKHGGNTPLMFAARGGDLASARLLVGAGADVDDMAASGVTALTMAVYANFGTILMGDQGVGSEGRSRFLLAGQERFSQRYSDPGIVRFLLENGADPNLGSEEFTGLHAAIMRQDEETLDLLLDFGADPNLPLGAWTPLRRLSPSDFYFHKGWVGASPLWLAARFGNPRVVERLLSAGADPGFVHTGVYFGGGEGGVRSDRQEEVTTPLMAAVGMSQTGSAWLPAPRASVAERELLEIVRLLVDAGVNPAFADPEGSTAIDGARALGHEAVLALLETRGDS